MKQLTQHVATVLMAVAFSVTGAVMQTSAEELPAPPAVKAPAQVPPTATAPAAPEAAPAGNPAAPTGLDMVRAGTLQLTPAKGIARMYHEGENTCVNAVVRFRVRNAGPADVHVAVFRFSLAATDSLGINLFGDYRGITDLITKN